MDRRTFIGSLLVAPLAAEAQPAGKVYRIGFLLFSPLDVQRYLIAAFEAGLREQGYTPWREVVIEYRSADGHSDQLPILAAELVRLGVDLIVTGVNPNTLAAKHATGTIPIVMASSFFPVEDGLVASLARPGGNITGLTQEAGEEVAKRLQFLREVVPKLTRVATLSGVGMTYNPHFVKRLQDVARGLGVSILPFEFQGADDVGKVFFEIQHAGADGLIVFGSPITVGQRSAIVSLTAEKRLPAVWSDKQFVLDGGLMSYGADVADLFRRSAGYVHRILKGAKPADLPVEQPTKFDRQGAGPYDPAIGAAACRRGNQVTKICGHSLSIPLPVRQRH